MQCEDSSLLLLTLKRERSGHEARNAGSLEKLEKAWKRRFPRAPRRNAILPTPCF